VIGALKPAIIITVTTMNNPSRAAILRVITPAPPFVRFVTATVKLAPA